MRIHISSHALDRWRKYKNSRATKKKIRGKIYRCAEWWYHAAPKKGIYYREKVYLGRKLDMYAVLSLNLKGPGGVVVITFVPGPSMSSQSEGCEEEAG